MCLSLHPSPKCYSCEKINIYFFAFCKFEITIQFSCLLTEVHVLIECNGLGTVEVPYLIQIPRKVKIPIRRILWCTKKKDDVADFG